MGLSTRGPTLAEISHTLPDIIWYTDSVISEEYVIGNHYFHPIPFGDVIQQSRDD